MVEFFLTCLYFTSFHLRNINVKSSYCSNTEPMGVEYLKILDITSNLVNDDAKPSHLPNYE